MKLIQVAAGAFLFVQLLFTVSCKRGPETVTVVQNYFGTTDTSRIYQTIDGKKEGKMVDYYKDGSLKAERFFKNDLEVGKTTLYHKNGAVREVQYFQDGVKHGGDTLFYDTGELEMVVTFDKGLKHGYVRKWKKDGTLTYEAKFDHENLVEVKGEKLEKDTITQ